MAAPSSPSTVTPLTRSARPAAPVTRSTGSRGTVSSDELVEAPERCRVEDTHEVPEILADDDVVRHLERSLLSISAHERRSVALREQRDRERDREEGDGRNRRHPVPRASPIAASRAGSADAVRDPAASRASAGKIRATIERCSDRDETRAARAEASAVPSPRAS